MSLSQSSITVSDQRVDQARHGKTLICFLAVFAIAMAVRLVNLNQPLVDGFIDRQVHTAMMARNIARGESILYPQIDIGPFPSYYMLEFPGYAALAGFVADITGLPLDIVGRSLSAFCLALACLFLMDLVRRREGLRVACLAAVAMALMPVTIRYGRAFQPDSMMLCSLIAAVWCADRWAQGGKWFMLIAASVLTGYALLLKVISAYVLVPLFYLVWERCGWRFWRSPLVLTALMIAALPSLWWYFHAYEVASGLATVSTPFWKLHKWFAPDRLVQESTYRQLAFFIGLRVLTPVGLILAAVGLAVRSPNRLFHIWSLGLITYIPILARKLDHEHYYFAIVPVAAVFIARALAVLYRADLSKQFLLSGRGLAISAGIALVAINLISTLR